MLSFGKFRDQSILVMRKTLYYLEHRMVISSITYCTRSLHVKRKNFLPQGKHGKYLIKEGVLLHSR